MRIWNFETNGRLGDMLEQSVEPYGLAELVCRLGLMQQSWNTALTKYRQALNAAENRKHAWEELNVACYFGYLAHSAWVLFSWFAWRYHREVIPDLGASRMRLRLKAELNRLVKLEQLLEHDPRLGFYEEDQKYYVTPALVRAKRRSDAKLLKILEQQLIMH